MAEKKKTRETVKHFLPDGYNGRCSGDQKYISKWVTVGGSLDKENEQILHRYEYRLPIPTTDAESAEMFNLSIEDLVTLGVSQLGNNIDQNIKWTYEGTGEERKIVGGIFQKYSPGEVADKVSNKAHLSGQEYADNWRYTPVQRVEKTAVSTIVQSLVAKGLISAEEAVNIKTDDDLQRAIANFSF